MARSGFGALDFLLPTLYPNSGLTRCSENDPQPWEPAFGLNLGTSFTLGTVRYPQAITGREKAMRGKMQRAALLMILLLSCQAVIRAQKGSPVLADRERERRSFAQNLVKAINAAEADYRKKHDVYANWDTLVGIGDFSSNGTKWAPADFPTVAHALYGTGAEIVPGWRLRLHLTNGDKAYDLLLEDVTDPKCGYAVFSDERGLIRQGKSIDCAL
jgi:hypothetical protein